MRTWIPKSTPPVDPLPSLGPGFLSRRRFEVRPMPVRLLAASVLAAGMITGCGGDEGERATAPPARVTPTTGVSARTSGQIPATLRDVESAAEDTIDFALAGQRREAIRTAAALTAAAHGPAAVALRDAGVPAADIAEFAARSDRVARLAPKGDLLRLALASNHAFAMVPTFFARFESPVPADVLRLDNLDFEAKLRAEAGDDAALRAAVTGLDRTWRGLRAGVVRAGGERAAREFDAHVTRMRQLAAGPRPGTAAAQEAQHGLDLVDEVEGVYGG
jgi:hypothetical protein